MSRLTRGISTTVAVVITAIIVAAVVAGVTYALVPKGVRTVTQTKVVTSPVTTTVTTTVTAAAPGAKTVTITKTLTTTIVKTITTTVTATPTPTTTPTVRVPPGKEIWIAVVSDIGGRGDLSFNDMAFKGAEEAARDFGVKVMELISKSEADYIPNLRTAAEDPRVKLIVGVGFLLSDALAKVAMEYPDKYFVGIDTYAQQIIKKKYPDKWPLPNLLDIKFEEHKGSALVGALACLLAIHYNYPHVGMVLGIEIPVLWKFEIGFKWGCNWAIEWYKKHFPKEYEEKSKNPRNILAVDPKKRVLWTYTGTFSDITKGYEAAKAMYAQGAIAVYNVAGPLGLGINRAVQEIARAKHLTMGLSRG